MHLLDLPEELSAADDIVVDLDKAGCCCQFGAGEFAERVEVETINCPGQIEGCNESRDGQVWSLNGHVG